MWLGGLAGSEKSWTNYKVTITSLCVHEDACEISAVSHMLVTKSGWRRYFIDWKLSKVRLEQSFLGRHITVEPGALVKIVSEPGRSSLGFSPLELIPEEIGFDRGAFWSFDDLLAEYSNVSDDGEIKIHSLSVRAKRRLGLLLSQSGWWKSDFANNRFLPVLITFT